MLSALQGVSSHVAPGFCSIALYRTKDPQAVSHALATPAMLMHGGIQSHVHLSAAW